MKRLSKFFRGSSSDRPQLIHDGVGLGRPDRHPHAARSKSTSHLPLPTHTNIPEVPSFPLDLQSRNTRVSMDGTHLGNLDLRKKSQSSPVSSPPSRPGSRPVTRDGVAVPPPLPSIMLPDIPSVGKNAFVLSDIPVPPIPITFDGQKEPRAAAPITGTRATPPTPEVTLFLILNDFFGPYLPSLSSPTSPPSPNFLL